MNSSVKKKMKVIRLKMKIWGLIHIRHKDPMLYQLELYRTYGAKIGGGVRAFSPVISAEPWLITVGDNTTISNNVQFITHDNSAGKLFENGGSFLGTIEIGRKCFIGAGSIILPGISLGDNVIVGAGSVVTRSFPDEGTVIAGNPARKISTVEQLKKKNECHRIDFSKMNEYCSEAEFELANSDRFIRR